VDHTKTYSAVRIATLNLRSVVSFSPPFDLAAFGGVIGILLLLADSLIAGNMKQLLSCLIPVM